MSQPPEAPFQPQPNPYQPAPAAAPAKKSRKGLIGGLIVGLVVGSIAGCAGGSVGNTTNAVPAAGATVTAPAPTVTVTATVEAAPSEEPEPESEPTEEEEASFEPKAKDFKIKVKTLSKQCFGSAGCSVTYRIDPEYVGDIPIPDTGTIEVTYEVEGPEDGAAVNTFTIEGGSASFDKEEDASTPSSDTKLVATVTDVSYDG